MGATRIALLALETLHELQPLLLGLATQLLQLLCHAEVGLELPTILVGFLESLRDLKANAPELHSLFSEYRVVRRNDYVYEVVLYPMHYSVPVRIGARVDPGMLQYALMMLDMLEREGKLAGAVELDFRSGEGVLRMREDRRG